MWERRAGREDIVKSGGRSVRGDWKGQLELVVNDIIDKMDFNSGDTVLDIGCSGGRLIKEISPIVKSVVGIDYSVNMVNKAKENTKTCNNVEILPASANNLPFEDDYFSKIICYSVFMYLGNFGKVKVVINEMRRVATHKARILIGDILDKNRKPSFWSLSLLRAQKGQLDLIQFLKENIGHHLGLHLWLEPETLKSYIEELKMKGVVLRKNESLQLSDMMFDLLIEVRK